MVAGKVLTVLGLAAAGTLGAAVGLGQEEAQSKREHTILTPMDVKWAEGPPVLPQGAKSAMLEGDPKKAELFHLRLKFPAGYKIPPHWHPAFERVTVVSGEVRFGLGEQFDESKMKVLPAGSFISLPSRTPHFVMTTQETIIQLSTVGPWDLTYVNPADDPRAKSK